MNGKLNVKDYIDITMEYPIRDGMIEDTALTIQNVIHKFNKLHPEENHDSNPRISISDDKLIFTFKCVNKY